MRHLFVAVACLLAAAACSPNNGTAPNVARIRVQILDDAGHSAGRNPIVVTQETVTRATATTRSDGTVDINIDESGEYTVKVIPRDGFFAGTDPLSKRVTLSPGVNAEVRFTLYRSGKGQEEPPYPGSW